MLKAKGIDMKAEYSKVIESFYWAYKAIKQMICNDAKPDEVLASIKDPLCKAWKLKLTGKDSMDPTTSAGSDDSNKFMPETSGCGENSRSR